MTPVQAQEDEDDFIVMSRTRPLQAHARISTAPMILPGTTDDEEVHSACAVGMQPNHDNGEQFTIPKRGMDATEKMQYQRAPSLSKCHDKTKEVVRQKKWNQQIESILCPVVQGKPKNTKRQSPIKSH